MHRVLFLCLLSVWAAGAAPFNLTNYRETLVIGTSQFVFRIKTKMDGGNVITWSEGEKVEMHRAISPPDDKQLWYRVHDDIFVSVYAHYAITANVHIRFDNVTMTRYFQAFADSQKWALFGEQIKDLATMSHCLDVSHSSHIDGTDVVSTTCSGNRNQKWQLDIVY